MNTITLPTGRVIPLVDISFDVSSNHFFYGSLDVTQFMTRSQMLAVGGNDFDVNRANIEASDAARIAQGLQPYDNGAELSYWNIATDTAKGIGTDISTAAQGIRDFVGIGPENTGKRSPLILVAMGLGILWLAWELGIFVWIKKKLTA